MANNPIGYDFKGNGITSPGRPKNPKHNVLKSTEFRQKVSDMMRFNKLQLEDILADPETDMLTLTAGKILYQAYFQGDHQRFSMLLDRLIGKVKDEVEIIIPKPTIIERLDGPSIEIKTELIEQDEDYE